MLSSCGARGLVHIGAIEELEAQGYRITSVAGCSMGAIMRGVYAAGKLKEFREWMQTINRKKMLELTDFSLSLNQLAKGTRIIEAIMEFVPVIAIEDLPIPYCAVATDLKAGDAKWCSTKVVCLRLYVPAFLRLRSTHLCGMMIFLIDGGGVMNPIPLNRVKRHSGEILVGIDVSGRNYEEQWDKMHSLTQRQKREKSLKTRLMDMLIPDNMDSTTSLCFHEKVR